MKNFDIDDFLTDYKPLPKTNLSCYTKLKSMKNYKWLEKKEDIHNLHTYDTRIKYIRVGYELADDKCKDSDIIDGGILIAGGTYLNGTFIESNDKINWTHLKLDTNISKKTGLKGKYYKYIIKIFNYNIFYLVHHQNSYEVILQNLKQ